MTTIAYRDGVLAADSLINSGNGGRAGHAVKISKGRQGTLGGSAGRLEDAALFRSWVERDCKGDAPSFSEGFDSLLILPDGRLCYVGEKGCIVPFMAEFAAIGSGEQFAMGAMAAGASAEDAVRIAIQLDTGSGGEVTMLKREE